MKRVFWFTAGVATGVAGTKWAEQKLKHAAAAAKPRGWQRDSPTRFAMPSARVGWGCGKKEAELRAEMNGTTEITEVVEVISTPTRRTRRRVRVRIARR